MSPEAWFTVSTIALVVAALVSNRMSVDVAMIGGLTVLMVGDFVFGLFGEPGRVLPFTDAIRGFGHPALLMIAALFVVAAGLQETGGIEVVAQRLLGRPKSVTGAQLRLMVPVAILSGFMNNTPIVAMYLPIVNDWARKLRISPSKLFMPLSFAAILGGKITLVGTASNITTMLLFTQYVGGGHEWLADLGVGELSSRAQFWGIAVLGVPTTIVGIFFICLASRWLLPERKPAVAVTEEARRYQVEMIVKGDSPIVGKTIEEAGLPQLPGLYLTKIERAFPRRRSARRHPTAGRPTSPRSARSNRRSRPAPPLHRAANETVHTGCARSPCRASTRISLHGAGGRAADGQPCIDQENFLE